MRRNIEPKISAKGIRKIRKAMGFSQEEFARFLWVTYSMLNRWEARRAVHLACTFKFSFSCERRLTILPSAPHCAIPEP